MGASISCPFAEFSDVETGLESIIVKPISFEDEEVKTPVRLVSFNSRDLEPTILTSLGSGKVEVEGSVSFKESELEELIKVNDTESPKNLDVSLEMPKKLPILDSRNPKHEAAIKLQKVYKSFRTRRKLADCAVLVEQSWWKLLDFAELKRSSISFFDIEKHETAISRWSRAGTRAAKVGKGLLKNDKAQKLALQHWLEAIDPRHRYGHNLNFYYNEWLHSKSREPFFYWLDIGKGKEVNLEKCSRSKLQQQCIKYLGPMERKAYEVVVKNGKFLYTQTGEHLNTFDDEDAKWIFVLSTTKRLYVGKKKKGTFQHSSFLAGGATTAAGRLTVDKGRLKDVCPHSGHYRPTQENFMDFISFLNKNNVDLRDVKMSPVDEEERGVEKEKSSKHIKSNSSVEGLTRRTNVLETDETNVEYSSNNVKADPVKVERDALPENPKSSKIHNLSRKLPTLGIPTRNDFVETLKSENLPLVKYDHVEDYDFADEEEEEVSDGEEDYSDDADTKSKPLDEDNEDENEVEAVPKEAILQRINSRKGSKSFQLGKQLSCKWSTGAGPRICCLRDYPLELQFRALEKVNLSPRSALGHSRSHSCFSNNSECFSSIVSMPTSSSPLPSGRSSLRDSFFGPVKKNLDQHSRAQSSPLGRRDSQNGLELNTKK